MRTIIFDFDHTLVRCDSFTLLNRDLLLRNWWRSVVFIILSPAVGLLYLSPKTRLLSLSLPLWVGTVGMNQASFESFLDRHVEHHYRRPEKLWCKSAISRLHSHQREGTRVWIATGCATPLAERICGVLGVTDVQIVGSLLRPGWGGYVATAHCIEENKVTMLMARGAGRSWDCAYTDSARDIPLLARARLKRLVNPSPAHERRIRASLGSDVEVLVWKD